MSSEQSPCKCDCPIQANCWWCVEYDWPIQTICSHIRPFFSHVIQNYHPLLIYVIPHYRTEGVSIQSHLHLDVCLDSHMVLQQLLFQLTRERRSKIWCQYISTGIERLKSIQLTASSWRQIFRSSLLYICISTRIFQQMWNICDCFFHCAAWVIIRALLVWRFYNCVYGRFPPHFTLVINRLKFQFDQSLSIASLVILLQIRPILLDWSPSLPGSFAVLRVVMSPK